MKRKAVLVLTVVAGLALLVPLLTIRIKVDLPPVRSDGPAQAYTVDEWVVWCAIGLAFLVMASCFFAAGWFVSRMFRRRQS